MVIIQRTDDIGIDKTSNCDTLSSEAEYVSLSEAAAKDVKFIIQVIESMGIKVEKPVEIRVDNISAIFMANNVMRTLPQTKHINVRYRYVTELAENGLISTIKFVILKRMTAIVLLRI